MKHQNNITNGFKSPFFRGGFRVQELLTTPNNRLTFLDLARGFTVLFIPIIHSIMLYGNEQTHQSGMVALLSFIAEWPGAQLFMMLMGIHFGLSKNKSFKQIILRSLVLLSAAYLLNLLKFVIPNSLNLLPKAFVNDISPDQYPLILIGDILHFAALAIPVLYILKKLPEYQVFSLIIAFVVCFASPNIELTNSHLFSLIAGLPPQTYFPLFPWLVYPLSGLAIGYFLKYAGSKTFLVLLLAGIGLMIIGFSISSGETNSSFYRPGPWKTILHLGFLCCWLSIWHIIAKLFKNTLCFSFLSFLSRNITFIYLIQWPFICWLLPFIGYHYLNISDSLIISLATSLTVFCIVFLIVSTNQKNQF